MIETTPDNDENFTLNDEDFQNMLKSIKQKRQSRKDLLNHRATNDFSITNKGTPSPLKLEKSLTLFSPNIEESKLCDFGLNPYIEDFESQNYDEDGTRRLISKNNQYTVKQNLESLYKTIKEEISPQKRIINFNKFAVDFNGYLNKISHENSQLKQRLKLTENKLKTTEKKLLIENPPKLQNENLYPSGTQPTESKRAGRRDKLFMKLDLVNLDGSFHEDFKKNIDFNEKNVPLPLLSENKKLKGKVENLNLQLSRLQQSMDQVVEDRLQRKVNQLGKDIEERCKRRMKEEFEHAYNEKTKKFLKKMNDQLNNRKRIMDSQLEEEIENRLLDKLNQKENDLKENLREEFILEFEEKERQLKRRYQEMVEQRAHEEMEKTLKESYEEWKTIHNQKIKKIENKLKTHMETELNLIKEKYEKKIEDISKQKDEEKKREIHEKETQLKELFDRAVEQKTKEKELALRSHFEYEKKLLQLDMQEKLKKYKRVSYPIIIIS